MIELSVENLHLTYGDNPVLKGVSMTLKRGEVVSLLGPSGSGKTTLLRAVAGLEKPTGGRIAIGKQTVYDGNPRSEIPAEARNLGLVFQSYALWPHKTVFENVAYPLRLRKVASGEMKQRVQAVLDQLGLGAPRKPPSASAIGRAAAARGDWSGAGLQPAGYPA
ncbi:ABC transporter ATP-binding protein [Raoultella ornithinolytica]|nr:ABC transporter ATP-binding protein [Raoultella ornithinolytica]